MDNYAAVWQQTIAAYQVINQTHPIRRAKFRSFADGVLTLDVDSYTAAALENYHESICHEFRKYSDKPCHSLVLHNRDRIIDLKAHQTETLAESEAAELKRLRAENEELKRRLAVSETRAQSYRALAAGNPSPSGVEGCNLAFLLPCLPEMPYLQAKAVLTLLALGGSAKMKAIEFARLMGKTGNTASYKRLFAGVDGLVIFDGKNLRLAQVLLQKLAISASSETTEESSEDKNLRLAQEMENQNLRNSQEIPENLHSAQENSPSYDDDDIYQNKPIEVISSSRQAVVRNYVLVFARERLGFNVKYPPRNLDQHTPINAIALVLQAVYSNETIKSKAGLWTTMINNLQPAEKRWLDQAYSCLADIQQVS